MDNFSVVPFSSDSTVGDLQSSCMKETFFAPNLGDEGVFGLDPEPYEGVAPASFSPFTTEVQPNPEPELGNGSETQQQPDQREHQSSPHSVSPPVLANCEESPIAIAYKEAQQDSAYSDSCVASPYGSLSPPQCLINKQPSPLSPSNQATTGNGNCLFAKAGQPLTVDTGSGVPLVSVCSIDPQAKYLGQVPNRPGPNPSVRYIQNINTGPQTYSVNLLNCGDQPNYLRSLPQQPQQPVCPGPSPGPFCDFSSGFSSYQAPNWQVYNNPPKGSVQVNNCRLVSGFATGNQYYPSSNPSPYWVYNNPEFPPTQFDLPDITGDTSIGQSLPNKGYNNIVYHSPRYNSLKQFPISTGFSPGAFQQLGPPPYNYTSLIQQQQQYHQQQQQQQQDFFLPACTPGYLKHHQILSQQQAFHPPSQPYLVSKMEGGMSPHHSDSMDSDDLGLAAIKSKPTSAKKKAPPGEKAKKVKKPVGKVPKKKKKKDPNEPQKPVSAYALFFRDTQAAIKSQNPGATFGEVSKIVASLWDNLDEDTKNEYKMKTEEAKKEYLQKLAVYRASLVSQGPLDTSSAAESSPTKVPTAVGTILEPMDREGSFASSTSNPSEDESGPRPDLAITNLVPHSVSRTVDKPSFPDNVVMKDDTAAARGAGDKNLYSNKTQENPPVAAMMPDRFYSKSVKSPCTRSGCQNDSVPSPKWNNDYCSTNCVVEHCREVFNSWVASQSGGVTS